MFFTGLKRQLLNRLKNIFIRSFQEKKKVWRPFHIASDFNLDILNQINVVRYNSFFKFATREWYNTNHKQAYKNNQKNAAKIDDILKNHFVDVNFQTAIFRTDVSDQFPICIIIYWKGKLVVITDDATESFNEPGLNRNLW